MEIYFCISRRFCNKVQGTSKFEWWSRGLFSGELAVYTIQNKRMENPDNRIKYPLSIWHR